MHVLSNMASARVVNYISYRRFQAVSTVANARLFPHLNAIFSYPQSAPYCTRKAIVKSSSVEQENKVQVGFPDVVKENVKSAGYLGVIMGGLGVTGFMFYIIFNELLSSKSPNSVYSKALERCRKDSRVINALGEPIKAYGEESRRGRRTHVSHITFLKDGLQHMRMKFYIQGIRRRGTVLLEVQENESRNYTYRYLYVQVEDIMNSTIQIEDNREEQKRYSEETDFELS